MFLEKPASYVTNDIYLLLERLGLLDKLIELRGTLCGGALTSFFSKMYTNDYDFYFKSVEDINAFNVFLEKELKSTRKWETENAITWQLGDFKLQVIQKASCVKTIVPNLLSIFDFTVCMAGIDFKEDILYLHEAFEEDIYTKSLIFNFMALNPLGTVHRLKKYINRGYIIAPSELLKVAIRINRLGLDTYSDIGKTLWLLYITTNTKDHGLDKLIAKYYDTKVTIESIYSFLNEYATIPYEYSVAPF